MSETPTPITAMGILHRCLLDLEALAGQVDEAIKTMVIEGDEAVVWPMFPGYGTRIAAMLQEVAERADVMRDRSSHAARMVSEAPSVEPENF